MLELSDFHQVEQALKFRYPPSFYAAFAELAALTQTARFKAQFARVTWLTQVADIRALRRQVLPKGLLPFMREQQPKHIDYYAFNLAGPQPEFPVVVFAIHTIVQQWATFADFFLWLQQRCQNNPWKR